MNATKPPALPKLGMPDFFLADLELLHGQFAAAQDLDDWDLAYSAFVALMQNAWTAHVLIAQDAPLHCPLVETEPDEIDMLRNLTFLEVD